MTRLHRFAAAAALAVTATLVAAPIAAQTMINEGPPPFDPIMQEAEDDGPRNTFYLNDGRDVELIRFKRTHDIELCAGRPNPNQVDAARHGYPIQVSWDSDVGIIMPGNCLTFDAMKVKVKPVGPIPQSIVLVGTVKVLR